jgi:hypothetical protein
MKTILMTVLGTMTMAVFAQEATPDTWMTEARSTASIAEVRAEAVQLRASGELARLHNPGYLPAVAHPRLRAEVVAELHSARQSGELAMLSAEAHDFGAPQRATAYAYRPVLARAR